MLKGIDWNKPNQEFQARIQHEGAEKYFGHSDKPGTLAYIRHQQKIIEFREWLSSLTLEEVNKVINSPTIMFRFGKYAIPKLRIFANKRSYYHFEPLWTNLLHDRRLELLFEDDPKPAIEEKKEQSKDDEFPSDLLNEFI